MVSPDAQEKSILTLCLPALNATTPVILKCVMQALAAAHLSQSCEDVTIALAEVLNNIVEHGYHDTNFGAVAVSVSSNAGTMTITVKDWGAAYPDVAIPDCVPPDPTQLAEGGYGWFLIKALMSDVSYSRSASTNTLVLALDT